MTLPSEHIVTSMAVSPDGKYLAACGADLNVPVGSDVTVWDLSTQTVLHHLSNNAHCVAFSADGKAILTGHLSRQIRQWSVVTGEELLPLELPPLEMKQRYLVRVIECSSDGNWAAAGINRGVLIWNVTDGQFRKLGDPIAVTYTDDLAFSPDGQVLAAALRDGEVRRWWTDTGEEIEPPLRAHTGNVLAIAFAPSGKVLASGGRDGSVVLWDAASGELLRTLSANAGPVAAVTFLDDDHLAVGKDDKTVTVWEWKKEGKEGRIRKGHGASITALAFVPNRTLLVSGSKDRQIKLWDSARTEEKSRLQVPSLDWGFQFIDFSPDSKTLSVAGRRDWQFWSVPSLAERPRFANAAWSVTYSPDGRLIATTQWDVLPPVDGRSGDSAKKGFVVRIWDASTRDLLATLRGPRWRAAPSFSPDGRRLLTGFYELTLWDIANPRDPREIAQIGDHGDKCKGYFFPKRNLILAGGATQTAASIWDATTGERLAKLETGHNLRCGAISPDERLIAIGTMDTAIQLWDVASQRKVATLKGHGDAVYALDFSPDGKTLASGSQDRTVKLWNVATGSLLLTLDDHHSFVHAVRFSPDGRNLVTGSTDAMIVVRRASGP